MANISITSVRTTDERGQPKSTFAWEDGFAVEVGVKRASSLLDRPIEVLIQIVNLRADPREIGPWRLADGSVLPSIDRTLRFVGGDTSLVFVMGWPEYREMMSGITTGEQGGVFVVRASVRAIGTEDFAVSAPFAASYQFIGYPPPAPPKTPPSGGESNGGDGGESGTRPPGNSGGPGRGPIPPVRTRFGFSSVKTSSSTPKKSSTTKRRNRRRS